MRETVLFMGCSFIRDSRRGCCRSSFSYVFVVLRAFATHTDGSDHFPVEDDGNSALQRSCSGQRERGNPAFFNLILEVLARTAEDSCGPGFPDANFDARDLRVVESLKQ